MRYFLSTFFVMGVVLTSFANHTKGGWIYYKYLGPGNLENTARYEIVLKIYTECVLNANQWCPEVSISIFDATNNTLYQTLDIQNTAVIDIQNCTDRSCHECISSIPDICYKIATFDFIKDLPINAGGYVLSYQRCCRIANIINLQPGSSSIGDTWAVSIPGSGGADPLAYKNSSALFAQNDTAIICKNSNFSFDFSATDPDGDSLVYSFTDAYYASRGNGTECISVASTPPYSFVDYSAPYSGSQPLGSGVTINPVTGIVSGIAPSAEGTYVLTCTVTEFKRGTNIVKSSVHKSLHIFVSDCSLTQAILDPEYYSCDSFSRTFSNEAGGGNVKTYHWDFGVAGTSNDTSNMEDPSFTYPDTGTYVLKLIVNKGLPCSDSAFSIVRVYPVFAPAFSIQGQCKNTPISFLDQTTTTYGFVNSWAWTFGDVSSQYDTSTLPNPKHYYTVEANYPASLTVSNSMGCRATLNKTVLITDKPALTLTNDTLICTVDTLQLNAKGDGLILWSPAYNINSLTSASPLVSPDVPTTYYARLSDPYGCVGTDSVFVDVKRFVTLFAGHDTTICQSDAIALTLSSDALHYAWTEIPATASLNDANGKNPVVTPLTRTRYHVIASIGKCIAQADITVSVVPYPKVNVGADTAICLGTSAQLHASGGSIYSWSPATFLTNRFIANPVSVKPTDDILYTVTVTDVLGCPKSVTASTMVNVQKITADAGPSDTTVVVEQPLQLNATGGSIYLWTPSRWLSESHIANPISTPQNDIGYIVRVSNSTGCVDYDSIHVKVYNVNAGIYVPTAFTPNNDGRNDFFRPISLGLRSLDIFRVYDRWGKLVYSSEGFESHGWDGTYKGSKQEPGTYTWYAEGMDYRNGKLKRKGFVVLIR